MSWDLPTSVELSGRTFNIRNRCDYRVVLDIGECLHDNELTEAEKAECCLFMFYEDSENIPDVKEAFEKMMQIVNMGEEETDGRPPLMDWEQDFSLIAPAVSKVLGYSVRQKEQYTHWYDFVGAFLEISGDSTFANIVSIRKKRQKGLKLEKYEREFYNENKTKIDLKRHFSAEYEEWLNGED